MAQGGRTRAGGAAVTVVGAATFAIGTTANDLPFEKRRRPFAEHPVAIELSARRCTASQDEHQGEGTKEGEDKFP